MSVDDCLKRITASLVEFEPGRRSAARNPFTIHGVVSTQRIELIARERHHTSSLIRVFRGRVYPAGEGCQLVGAVRTRGHVMVTTGLWLSSPFVILAVFGLLALSGGEVTPAAFVVIPLFAAAALLVLERSMRRLRRAENYLISWLARTIRPDK